jgi:hypothetical protein
MSTYLNSNMRRTAIEAKRFFQETPRLNGLDLSCCRENIVQACRSNPSGQTNNPIGKGSPYETMNFHGLRFTWFENANWSFTGPCYGVSLTHTCSREDASKWLDGLYTAEGSSRSLERGPRLIHELGGNVNAEEHLVCSHHVNVVTWPYLDNRLFSVRLAEATAGTVEPVALWRMILFWTARVPLLRLHQ